MRSAPAPGSRTTELNRSTAAALAAAPFALVGGSLLLWRLPSTRELFYWLSRENRPVELATFVLLVWGGVLALRLRRRAAAAGRARLTTLFYATFAVGLFFVALEEVSWGQWIFGFEAPAGVQSVNLQGELNVHNLPGLQVGFEILRVFYGLGGLIGVLLAARPWARDLGVPAVLAPWFALIVVLAGLDLRNHFLAARGSPILDSVSVLVEILELMIATSAFLYLWLNLRRFSREWRPAESLGARAGDGRSSADREPAEPESEVGENDDDTDGDDADAERLLADNEIPVVELEITDVLDLHSFPPRDQKAVVLEYLDAAWEQGLRELRIIHGRGIGVQREMVRKVLGRDQRVETFGDAPGGLGGGWGATVVTLKKRG